MKIGKPSPKEDQTKAENLPKKSVGVMPNVLAPGLFSIATLALSTLSTIPQAEAKPTQVHREKEAKQVVNEKNAADYFLKNSAEIKLNLAQHITDKKILEKIIGLVDMIAGNQNGSSFKVKRMESSGGPYAKYTGGGNSTVYLSAHFDIRNKADQMHLIHEVMHVQQDEKLKEEVKAGRITEANYENFFWHSLIHDKEAIEVPEYEVEAVIAQVEYLNAQLNGEVKSIVLAAPNLAEATTLLQNALILKQTIPNKKERASFVGKAVRYYRAPDTLYNHIRHLYECKHDTSRFTPQLIEIGKTSKDECKELSK